MLLAAELPIKRARHSALARVHAGFGRQGVLYGADAPLNRGADVMLSFVAQPASLSEQN
jgi:hypothetical protein